jgi:hypothetical protein
MDGESYVSWLQEKSMLAVWFTAYPISMITKPGHSFLSTLADEDLWRAFEAIGIHAVHTGPVKRAGGILGVETTPSVDGHFDRISTPATRHLPRPGDQGHQLERDRTGHWPGRDPAALGIPALLHRWSSLDQLAVPDVRRHAAGHRRRSTFA